MEVLQTSPLTTWVRRPAENRGFGKGKDYHADAALSIDGAGAAVRRAHRQLSVRRYGGAGRAIIRERDSHPHAFGFDRADHALRRRINRTCAAELFELAA